jgi:hypothetical protein
MTQATNAKEQVEPMLATLKAQSEVLGTVERLIADSAYGSGKNIKAADIDPLIAVTREKHCPGWRECHSEPALLPDDATTPVQTMSHRLKIKDGRARDAFRRRNTPGYQG